MSQLSANWGGEAQTFAHSYPEYASQKGARSPVMDNVRYMYYSLSEVAVVKSEGQALRALF